METESTPRQNGEEEEGRLISSQAKKRSRTCKCLTITTAIIIILGLVILILALTVFKAKEPQLNVKSVTLRDIDFDLSQLRFKLNVSLDVQVSVRNPNRVGFRYKKSTAYLRYKGEDVGEVPLAEDGIGPREERDIRATLTLMADRLLSDRGFYSGVVSGSLPLETYVRISGRVRILFVRIHVVTCSTCEVVAHIGNRSMSDPSCRYKAKL